LGHPPSHLPLVYRLLWERRHFPRLAQRDRLSFDLIRSNAAMLPGAFVLALGMIEYWEEDFAQSRLVRTKLDLLVLRHLVVKTENSLIVEENSIEVRDC
jgi:hypothetical protein